MPRATSARGDPLAVEGVPQFIQERLDFDTVGCERNANALGLLTVPVNQREFVKAAVDFLGRLENTKLRSVDPEILKA